MRSLGLCRKEGGSYFNAQACVWPGASQLTLVPVRRHPLALLSLLNHTTLGLVTSCNRTL